MREEMFVAARYIYPKKNKEEMKKQDKRGK